MNTVTENTKDELGTRTGVNKMILTRIAQDWFEVEIDGKKAQVRIEDMVAAIQLNLPRNRGMKLFAEIDEKPIMRGFMNVKITATRDVKRGENLIFKVPVNKYLDKNNQPFAIRADKNGFIF